ncbi:MAG: hypothetical protein GX660_06425 [Clostridiaceae bacterium]|nr:hypothetical protein [Clostridiaceae bacterium]
MSTKELKDMISRVLDDIPEDVLVDVLEYLKSLTNKSGDTVRLTQNLRQILDEDKHLLEQLAK